MFGGIVECTGKVLSIENDNGCKNITIQSDKPFNDLIIGDSISVNGICLSIIELTEQSFTTTAVPETLRVTNIDQLMIGSSVNLERSLKAETRIGGHYVQGHVDAIGHIQDIQSEGDALLIKITIPSSLSKYIVKKGYIALDGMSITIIDVGHDWFTVTLIPLTQSLTIAQHYCQGQSVNIEVDILGKYVEKLLLGSSYANTH